MTGEGGFPPRPGPRPPAPAPDAGGGAPRRRRRWPFAVAACALLLVFSIGGCMAVAVNNYFKESRENDPMNTPPTERQLQIARDLGRSELVLGEMEKGWWLSDEAVEDLGFGSPENYMSVSEAEAAIDYLRERYGEEFAVTKITHTPELLDRSYGFLAHATTGGHADEEFRVKFGVQNREPGDPEVWAYWDTYLYVSRGGECADYVDAIVVGIYGQNEAAAREFRIEASLPYNLISQDIDPALPLEEMTSVIHPVITVVASADECTLTEEEYYSLIDRCVGVLKEKGLDVGLEFYVETDPSLNAFKQKWHEIGVVEDLAEKRGL